MWVVLVQKLVPVLVQLTHVVLLDLMLVVDHCPRVLVVTALVRGLI